MQKLTLLPSSERYIGRPALWRLVLSALLHTPEPFFLIRNYALHM